MSELQDPNALLNKLSTLLDTMYGGYVTGDRESIDRQLDPQLTMFDSASPDLLSGFDELNALRAARTPEEANDLSITVLDPRIREIEGTIVATWWLRIDGKDNEGASIIPEYCRNSALLLPRGDSLVIAHLHEDVWQPLGGPVAKRTPSL